MPRRPRPADLFSSRLGAPVAVTPELERAVDEMLAASAAAWPGIRLTPEQFLTHLAEKMDEGGGDGAAIARALQGWQHTADLYLACACSHGDAVALAAFEARYVTGLGAVVERFSKSGVAVDEIQQALREKLFVGDGARRPTIAEYSGRAPLASWVFVVSARVALNLVRASKQPLAEGDEKILGLPAPDSNQELAYLKKLYKSEFAAALKDAMSSLPARDRTLLRQHYVDGVTLKQLAGVHGVHRVTLVHWVERAREALRDQTHHLLLQRLGITARTLASITRLVQSQFGISLGHILQGEEEPASENAEKERRTE